MIKKQSLKNKDGGREERRKVKTRKARKMKRRPKSKCTKLGLGPGIKFMLYLGK